MTQAADSLQSSSRLKHVHISDLYVRQGQARHELIVTKIDTRLNPSDIFTKPLLGETFTSHRDTVLGATRCTLETSR